MSAIKIETKDKNVYVLEYDKKTVKRMSNEGFAINKYQENPIAYIPQLFAGAFYKNHRTASQVEIDHVWDAIPDKEGFIDKLMEMYATQINELFAEPDEAKKAVWEVI